MTIGKYKKQYSVQKEPAGDNKGRQNKIILTIIHQINAMTWYQVKGL